jgi:hypothetical protein
MIRLSYTESRGLFDIQGLSIIDIPVLIFVSLLVIAIFLIGRRKKGNTYGSKIYKQKNLDILMQPKNELVDDSELPFKNFSVKTGLVILGTLFLVASLLIIWIYEKY